MDKRVKFWQDNFSIFARTKKHENDVNVYGLHSWERRKKVFSELASHLAEAAVLGPGKLAADIGCGSGMLSRILASAGTDVVACDLCFDMLLRAGREDEAGKLMLVNADCEHLPFPDSSFDFAAGNGLVTILSDPTPFFNELNRILKPGGIAMIEVLNSCWLGRLRYILSPGYDLPSDVRVLHYLPWSLTRLLEDALETRFVHTLPIVRLNPRLSFLEEPLQSLARKIPLLALPFASSFILLARKD